MKSLADSVIEMIGNIKKIKDRSSISLNTEIQTDLSISSLEMVSLLTNICTEHNIDLLKLSDLDILQMKTIGDIIRILGGKK